jgi:hypothetical protein
MTIIKSLKYPSNQEGRETIRKHRTHRSKKSRHLVHGWELVKDYKQRVSKLKEEELLLDNFIKL